MKGRCIRKSLWSAYWKLHDKKKMLAARLKGYLDGLPPKTRKRIVLAMFAAFAALALYTFGKALYDIGRNDGSRMVTDHAGQVVLYRGYRHPLVGVDDTPRVPPCDTPRVGGNEGSRMGGKVENKHYSLNSPYYNNMYGTDEE